MTDEDYVQKTTKLRELMQENDLGAILLGTQTNMKWLTGGRNNPVLKTSDASLVTIAVTPEKSFLIATASDARRVSEEEVGDLEMELCTFRWYDESPLDCLKRMGVRWDRLGSDLPLEGTVSIEDQVKGLRSVLTAQEIEKLRQYSREYSALLTDFCRGLLPRVSEWEIESNFRWTCLKKGFIPSVAMVGSDERVYKYRHPIATQKKVEKYIMIATCVEKDGLQMSLSRAVHFGEPPKELEARQHTVNAIEAACYAMSVPGVTLAQLFKQIQEVYAEAGYPGEWQNHSLGGIIAYTPREFAVAKDSAFVISNNVALSYNPTIPGVKSEDIVVMQNGAPEQLSVDPKWPSEEIAVENQSYRTPLIMQLS